ncbi:Lysophospholipase L1 [Verrucomicrobium sp. GAS474]|uniref:SGNH/GDSL hydrolase family protein n=1 Tax=Verrucomicrobium sp. GAS474 TaxID=1882831 RepID=UPI00087D2A0C|nr:GDSL-type esterase/lipase family protein [Verrucomicrobium sp. GAS474]SDU31864.1 Lysophospholipase L1 [Verrucomicrobium sp. GAS474]
MKKLLLLALLGASACAHAQDKVNSPNFQGAARSNLDMGGHSVIGAGAVSIGSGSGAVSVSASSGGLNVSGAGGTGGVTIQGNTFNAANQLVKLDGGGMLLPQFLPKATSSILGAVKIGGGLAVAGDGTLSLPVASASVLGGVKIGSGLAIDGSAILSLDASATTQGNAFNAPGKLVKLNTDQYFIFEGDSITAGAFATHPFSYYFASMSFASGRGTIINDAVSGSTISPGSGSGNNVSDRYNSNVKPYRPSASGGSGGATAYLFLMIGTNDIGNLGNTGSQVITALGTYCAQARSDGFTLVLSTITPRTSAYGWTATMEGYRQQVNSAIRNGTIPCDILIDYAAALSNPADTGLYYDGLHPLDAGQQVLARYLNGVMAGKGAGVPATPGYTDVPFAGMNFTGPITFPQNSKLTDGSSNTLSFFSSGSIPSGPSFGVSTANVYLDAAGGSSSEIGIGKNHTGSKILLRGYELNADTEHGMTLNRQRHRRHSNPSHALHGKSDIRYHRVAIQ